MREFQLNLINLRKERQLSQRDLANALGVSCGAISHYESGKREPNFEMMEKIADYFNVSMGSLIGDDGASRLMKQSEVLPIDKDRQDLLNSIKDFDDKKMARLIAYADFLRMEER